MKKFVATFVLTALLAACGGGAGSHEPDVPVFRAGKACFVDPGVLEAGKRYVLTDCSSTSTSPVWAFRHYDKAGVLRAEVTGGLRPEFVVFSDYTLEVVYCVGTDCVKAVRGSDGRLVQVADRRPVL